jgi:hypothetical protein
MAHSVAKLFHEFRVCKMFTRCSSIMQVIWKDGSSENQRVGTIFWNVSSHLAFVHFCHPFLKRTGRSPARYLLLLHDMRPSPAIRMEASKSWNKLFNDAWHKRTGSNSFTNGKCTSKSAYRACLQVLHEKGAPSPAPVCNQVKTIFFWKRFKWMSVKEEPDC